MTYDPTVQNLMGPLSVPVSEPSEVSERGSGSAASSRANLTGVPHLSEVARAADQGTYPRSDGSDGSDTNEDAEAEARLLASIRDGAWLEVQEFPPLSYAVNGLITEGFALLIGPPKAGKSWLGLDIQLAVACGGYALGAIPTGRPRRVLYLALEDGDRRMQDRCRRILQGRPIPPLFHYMTTVHPGFVPATLHAFLRRYPDTALIVIDTLGKIMPQSMPGESAYQRDYRVAGGIKRIADAYPGLAIVAVHHDRKAASDDFVESVSGTNGLAGAADTIIVLARKRQATEAVLLVTGRDVPEAEYGLTMDDGLWRLDGANLAEAATAAQQRHDSTTLGDVSVNILAFVRQYPNGCRAKDVVEKFGDDAYQYLKRLEESGRLTKPRRGFYVAPTSGPGEVCTVCGDPLDPIHSASGETTHPACDPAA